MADADETIITRFVVEADEAIKKAQEFRITINQIKEQLKILPKEAKENLSVVSKAMVDAFRTERLKQAKEEIKEALDIKPVMQRAQSDIQIYRTAMTQALKEVRQEQTAQAKESQQQAVAMKSLDSQVQQSGKTFRIFGQEIKNVGDLARVVLLGVFGVSVISMLRSLVRSFGEAAQSGYEFAKAIFQLEVGARALQRAGVDVTIQQIYEQIGSLQERFKIFTTKDLVVGTAAFLNLNRDMGFTREQLFKLQDAIATLAVVNGRAMDEVQRTVALALSSGYTEGLQRLGVSINRVTIANEAARLGFAKSYMSLTEQQRALATYNLVIQKTSIYQQDLQKYFETAPGAVDRTKTAFQELKNQFGLLIATNVGMYLQEIYKYFDTVNRAIEQFKASRLGQAIQGITERLKEFNKELNFTQQLVKGVIEWMLRFTFIKSLPSPFGQIIASLERMAQVKGELDKGILGDEAVGETERQAKQIEEAVSNSLEALETFQKEYTDKLRDINTDYQRDIEKLDRDYNRRREELARDLYRDLANIDRDGMQKREDLQRDYYNRLHDIEVKLGQDIAEENAKYALNVAQTQRDFALRRTEMEARYRENEKKAEIRFQEEMRRLREGFLFDLEDALHERDARQVLRLIRQYNLQKTQAERQYEIERDERRRAFELELKELEAQRQERLRILAEEHAARLAAIAAQAAYERELAARKYAEDKAELERRLEEEKADRIAKALEAEEELKRRLEEAKADRKLLLEQQIADLNTERDKLLEEIGNKLWNSLQITTDEGLKKLYEGLLATLGPGGDADKVFQYYAQAAEAAARSVEGNLSSVAAMMAQLYAFAASLQSLSGAKSPSGGSSSSGGGGSTTPRTGNPRKSGGEVYKGEIYKIHKDETFVPAVNGRILSVQQSQQAMAQSRSPMGTGSDSKVKIGVALADGLVGEIIEQATDAAGNMVAGVVVELERRRR